MALKWYKQGRIDKIIEYCKKDVEITKERYIPVRFQESVPAVHVSEKQSCAYSYKIWITVIPVTTCRNDEEINCSVFLPEGHHVQKQGRQKSPLPGQV